MNGPKHIQGNVTEPILDIGPDGPCHLRPSSCNTTNRERERLHVNNYRKAVGEDSHVTSVCRLDPKGDEDKDVEQQRQEEQDVVPPNSGGRGEEGRYSPAQLQRSFLFTKLTGMR